MGILHANQLCANILLNANSVIKNIENTLNEFKIYIDGPILVFSGLRKDTLKDDSETNTEIITINVIKKFRATVNRLSRLGTIKEIIIVFDGTAPKMKAYTQRKRRETLPINFDIKNTFDKIKKHFKNSKQLYVNNIYIPISVIEPEKGEAESIIYLNRDVNYTSVLYSKDTDLYAIAYAHQAKTNNDQVYFYNDNLATLVDMEKFKCVLSPFVFRLLLVLAGTDFNGSLFTNSMILGLMNVFTNTDTFNSHQQAKIYESISKIHSYDEDVMKIIGEFILLLPLAKLKTNIQMPRKYKSYKISNVFGICETLKWVIGYFNMGSEYSEYNRIIPECIIDKNEFVLEIVRINGILKGYDLTVIDKSSEILNKLPICKILRNKSNLEIN